MRASVARIAVLVLAIVGPAMIGHAEDRAGTAHDFTFESIDGSPLPLADFKGKAMLVVNTASFCGYTKQYSGLQELWTKYEPKGLVVIGVPSNDFGGQEPNSEAEIKDFCQGAFGVTFPLTAKAAVKGALVHPFYAWARAALGSDAAPGWNFHKYLIGRDGRAVSAFSSQVPPDSAELTAAIERALASR